MTPAFDDPRLERLARKLSEASSDGAVTLAYSGGLDSRFLAFFAKLAGFRVRLLHVTGPHVAPAETAEAVAEARAMGLETELVPLDPADMPDLAAADACAATSASATVSRSFSGSPATPRSATARTTPTSPSTVPAAGPWRNSASALRLPRPTSARPRSARSAPHSAFAIRVRWQDPACSPAFPTA